MNVDRTDRLRMFLGFLDDASGSGWARRLVEGSIRGAPGRGAMPQHMAVLTGPARSGKSSIVAIAVRGRPCGMAPVEEGGEEQ